MATFHGRDDVLSLLVHLGYLGYDNENAIRDSVVVFVCDFDPLGAGLSLYDLRTVCLQTGEAVADGRRAVMLSARGPLDDVPASLAAFLRLAAGEEVVGDGFCGRVKAIIERKVADPEWMEDCMTFEDELEAARRNAERRGTRLRSSWYHVRKYTGGGRAWVCT